MKTFTLRLNEKEAEALDRIAAIKGTSRNALLRSMIVQEYTNIDYRSTWIDDELLAITPINDFPASVEQNFNERNQVDEKAVIKAYDYAMEKEQDHPNLQTLEADRDRFINKVIENKFF